MKSKVMKSILTISACLVMLLVAGFVLAACGGTKENITVPKSIEFNGAVFETSKDFKLVKNKETGVYEAQGTYAEMNDDQLRAWLGITDAETSVETYEIYYANIKVALEEGSMVKRGFVSEDFADETLTNENCARFKEREEKGDLSLVLGFVEAGVEGFDLRETPIFRIEVTAPVAEGEEAGEPVVYLIDFTSYFEAEEPAA